MIKLDAKDQTRVTPDPFTRVRFAEGLLLGRAEFEQEQGYFRARGDLAAQTLHGCGTVSGLRVTTDGSLVVVAPGLAVDPLGRLLLLRTEQYCNLDGWLGANWEEFPVDPRPQSLYVTLSYGETPTEPVFIPAPPGRPQDRTTYSRVTEHPVLSFTRAPGPDPAAEARGRLHALLSRVRIGAEVVGVTPAHMEELVRALLQGPPSQQPIFVHPHEAEAVFKAAFRVWATEVEPAFGSSGPQEIILARIDFTLRPDGRTENLTAIDRDRPILLPTDVLQQTLLHALASRAPRIASGVLPHPVAEASGDLSGLYPAPSVTGIHGRPISAAAPEEGATLVWAEDRGRWEPRQLPSMPGDAKPVLPFVTITRLPGMTRCMLDLWFHLPVDITTLHHPFDLAVYAEPSVWLRPGEESQTGLSVPVLALKPRGHNRMELQLDPVANEHPHLRFEFRIRTGRRPEGRRLTSILEQSGTNWLGYDGRARIITYFRQPEQPEPPITEVVAAGVYEGGQLVRGRNLQVTERGPGLYLLSFAGYQPSEYYVVKGSPRVHRLDYQRSIEVIREQEESGIVIRAAGPNTGFSVEISRLL